MRKTLQVTFSCEVIYSSSVDFVMLQMYLLYFIHAQLQQSFPFTTADFRFSNTEKRTLYICKFCNVLLSTLQFPCNHQGIITSCNKTLVPYSKVCFRSIEYSHVTWNQVVSHYDFLARKNTRFVPLGTWIGCLPFVTFPTPPGLMRRS